MDFLLDVLRCFFRRTHGAGLNLGQLAVLVALCEREQTCMEVAVVTGYERSAVRQVLQRLKQLGDVEMRPWRSSGHGQVEYVYFLTAKGKGLLDGCLGVFGPVLAELDGGGKMGKGGSDSLLC